MSERKLAPGAEAKIEVKVNTAGRRGRLGKTVRVYSNDPDTPVAMLAVEAMIDAPQAALPAATPPLKRVAPGIKRPPTSAKTAAKATKITTTDKTRKVN